MVRSVLARILGELGHELMFAENGEQAQEKSRAHDGEIDLLITDVVMAKMGGLDLARCLATERPHLRVLLISGYSWDQDVPADDLNDGIDFLQKPFTPQELSTKVTRLLSTVRVGPSRLVARVIQSQQQHGRGDQ